MPVGTLEMVRLEPKEVLVDIPTKLAVVGSTLFTDDPWKTAAQRLIGEFYDSYQPELVISGGARGIDTIAIDLAERRDIPTKVFKPANHRWAPNGYQERNAKIAEACTYLLAIRHPESKTYGSGWTADYAERLGKHVVRVMFNTPYDTVVSDDRRYGGTSFG